MLTNIKNNEKLECSNSYFENLYNYYKSDVRSMINHLQSKKNDNILNNENYKNITKYAKTNDLNNFIKYFNSLSNIYNIDKKNIIKNYSSYIIFDFKDNITEYIDKFKIIIRNLDTDINYILSYLYLIINKYL